MREKYYLISRNGGFQTLLMVIILLFPVLAKKCFFYEDFESVEVRTQFFSRLRSDPSRKRFRRRLVVLEGDLGDGLSVLEHILDLHNLDDSERFVHHEVAEGPESLR